MYTQEKIAAVLLAVLVAVTGCIEEPYAASNENASQYHPSVYVRVQ